MKGSINMMGNVFFSLPDQPAVDSAAVNKKWVEDKISSSSISGLSASGFRMTGNIDMGDHEILNVTVQNPNPPERSAVNVKWVGDNFGKLGGFKMGGGIDMGTFQITNLNPVPFGDNSAVTKKWVENHVASGIANVSGIRMKGNIDMDGFDIGDLNPTPQSSLSAITKQWAENTFVKKTRLTIAEWSWGYMNVGPGFAWPYRSSGWPESTRSDLINAQSNIEVKCISFDNELTKAEIAKGTLEFKLRTISAGDVAHDITLLTLDLSTKPIFTG